MWGASFPQASWTFVQAHSPKLWKGIVSLRDMELNVKVGAGFHLVTTSVMFHAQVIYGAVVAAPFDRVSEKLLCDGILEFANLVGLTPA